MTEPLYKRLEHELAGDITKLFHHGHYHDQQQLQPQEGNMSLATFEADLRNDVQTAVDKGAELLDHLKTIAEARLPEVAEIAQKAQASPVVQALEAVVLTPAEESMIARIISELPSLRVTTAPDVSADPVATADPQIQTGVAV